MKRRRAIFKRASVFKIFVASIVSLQIWGKYLRQTTDFLCFILSYSYKPVTAVNLAKRCFCFLFIGGR